MGEVPLSSHCTGLCRSCETAPPQDPAVDLCLWSYRSTSLIIKCPTPEDHHTCEPEASTYHRVLGGGVFFMGEVPLYGSKLLPLRTLQQA
jgi:hypothetical protein